MGNNTNLEAINANLKANITNLEANITNLEALVGDLKERLARKGEGDGDEDDLSDDEEVEDDTDPWNIKYKELRQYLVKNGNCMVPSTYKRNLQLAGWVQGNDRSTRTS